MAWRLPGDKPLFEPVMVRLLTHICATQPQWVKTVSRCVARPFARSWRMWNRLPLSVPNMGWFWRIRWPAWLITTPHSRPVMHKISSCDFLHSWYILFQRSNSGWGWVSVRFLWKVVKTRRTGITADCPTSPSAAARLLSSNLPRGRSRSSVKNACK